MTRSTHTREWDRAATAAAPIEAGERGLKAAALAQQHAMERFGRITARVCAS